MSEIQSQQRPPKPGPEHKLLEIFIGKWMNEGATVAAPGEPPVRITTSDVYEWMPGGFFVLHNKIQTAHHVRLDENGTWVPSMEVVLIKVQ